MNKTMTLIVLICCICLTGCNSMSIGIIGGDDGPTAIYVNDDNIRKSYDIDKLFYEKYIDEKTLPILDLHIDREYVSQDRKLILDDSIENGIEHLIYEFYHNSTSGLFENIYKIIAGENLTNAIKSDENNFNDGIYYSEILIDEIDLVDKDELDNISENNQVRIIDILNELKMDKFAIVEVECSIKHNDKSLSMAPQVGNGDISRYYLVGKAADEYKICEVFWEGFIYD